jgi:hypothetical protein
MKRREFRFPSLLLSLLVEHLLHRITEYNQILTKMSLHKLFLIVCVITVSFTGTSGSNKMRGSDFLNVDVCVYGATPSGIMAAIAVREEGLSVVIVEPGRWVGGILGAGIKPIQDCPNFQAVGGRTSTYMKMLGTDKTKPGITDAELRKLAFSVSPASVRGDFLEILSRHHVRVIYDHRIRSCTKMQGRIDECLFDYAPFDETGCPVARPKKEFDLRIKAKVFIDAGYEGDLLAGSGVSFRTGRESSFDFSEQQAGNCEPTNLTPLDPFVEKGDSGSGLLPQVEDRLNDRYGAGDYYIQAYNFRYYVTSDPQYRIGFQKPENYQATDFELVGRYIESLTEHVTDPAELLERLSRIFPGWLNAGEYNYHRESLFTMAPVGISHLYANGDYAVKAQIWKEHQHYLSGLHYFLCTDTRVPEVFRKQTAGLGLDIRHHPDTRGWPHQLYARESRRLAGRYVITTHDVYNKTQIDDPIALAQYGIDTYPSRRIWIRKEGKTYVGLEGNMFIGEAEGPTRVPYPIPYRAITPKKHECTNLLVPVCFSATHLGYASARMEPVFMMCGESAGIAAVRAIIEDTAVQDIDMKTYLEKLISLGQKLEWKPNP